AALVGARLGGGGRCLAGGGRGAGESGEGAQRSSGGGNCSGTLYTVGRINYSTRDSRLTDSLVRLEYGACRPAAAKRPLACSCNGNSSACPGSAPIRCAS